MLVGVVVHNLQSKKSILVEHPSTFSLPGGLMIKTYLVDLPNHQPCQLPVMVVNESDHYVTIPARSAIAEMSLSDCACQSEKGFGPIRSRYIKEKPEL